MTVKLPRLGETTDGAVVIEWYKQVGDDVAEDEALLSVDTAKVESDVPSPVGGRLAEQLVEAGDEIVAGAPIAVLVAEASPDHSR